MNDKNRFFGTIYLIGMLFTAKMASLAYSGQPISYFNCRVSSRQTHVRAVEESTANFGAVSWAGTDGLPDVSKLQYIMHPLGLNYRAERLKRCAEAICRDYEGKVPWCREQLISLPGVENTLQMRYSVMLSGPTVPIDTNVIRLFTRYFGLIV